MHVLQQLIGCGASVGCQIGARCTLYEGWNYVVVSPMTCQVYYAVVRCIAWQVYVLVASQLCDVLPDRCASSVTDSSHLGLATAAQTAHGQVHVARR